jgi:class 3 adenylate cyclase/tetratricopeptide (TPR) repeat protein
MSEIVQWLDALGLRELGTIFEQNNIDVDILPHLTEQDLKDLGLSIGHRRRIQAAIAKLRREEPLQPQPSVDPAAEIRTAERRLITVMFCDLVGSTALSTKMDPEDLNSLVTSYRDACAQPIQRYGGFISRFVGDGILACFGYPHAHEDDAERAIRAGLGIVESMKELKLDNVRVPEGSNLAVRIGIGTGLVVVGDVIGRRQLERDAIVGETPNLAARLQALAEPNCVTIASETKRLAGENFAYRSLGFSTLKGIDTPIEVWQVVNARDEPSRFAIKATRAGGVYGRNNEVQALVERWEEAKSGNGQVVLIRGEPGIGKSHLTETLRRQVAADPQGTKADQVIQCSPHFANTALYPIIRHLEVMAGYKSADSAEDKLAKLEEMLKDSEANFENTLPLFAHVLDIPLGGRFSGPELSPRQRRERALEALKRWFLSFGKSQAALLVIEDEQWVDPTTKILLDRLVAEAPSSRLLIIITHRADFETPWLRLPNVTQISLDPLDYESSKELISTIVGPRTVPADFIKDVFQITGGVPLFIEEYTRNILSSNILKPQNGSYLVSAPLSSLGIPTTIHGALLARIDQLGNAKTIAQLAATIGRDFALNLLSLASGLTESELSVILRRLTELQLIVVVGEPRNLRYSFRHALIQNAAYDSMLRSTRQQFHLKIAEAAEREGTHAAAAELELLAYHYAQAGKHDIAITYWGRAAEHALARSALFEAATHLRRALDLLGLQQPSRERSQQELLFTTQLGAALRATRGYGAPDVEELYLRARTLSREIGDLSKQFVTEWGLMQVYLVKGKLADAGHVAAWLLDFATKDTGRELLMDANLASGMANLHQGRIQTARSFLQQSISLYRPEQDGPRVLTHAQDPGIFAQGFHHWVLWFLGLPDTSAASIEQTMQLARRKGHVFSLVSALTFGIRVRQCLRDFDGVEQLVDELFTVSRDGGYEYYEAIASVHRGWVFAIRDDDESGLELMNEGLTALEKAGTVLGLRGLAVELAEGHNRFGRKKDALAALDRARVHGGTHLWDAEVARMHGEVLANTSPTEQDMAESVYREALQIAREQEALSLELRTATCLARLLATKNRAGEAINLVEQPLSRFNEGFETWDLRAAQAVLHQLN